MIRALRLAFVLIISGCAVDCCFPTINSKKTGQINIDPEGYTLQHVHIQQRHGLRAPTSADPKFSPPDYYPMGIGYLTKLGKQQALKVGSILRTFYQNYLDDNPHNVWARSSSVPRCFETLYLLLSTLYPPRGMWDFGHPVQPIPITRVPDGNDVIIADCIDQLPTPRDFSYLNSAVDKALEADGFDNFGEFVEWVTSKSGYSANSSSFFEPIIDALYAQRYNKLPVPSWAKEKWSSMDFAMRKLSVDYYIYDIPYYGEYASKFIAEKVQEGARNNSEKLSIMNYHDTNIQAILLKLKMDVTDLYPSFLASLHFQLYKKNSDDTLWVRTLYHQGFELDGTYRPAVPLNIPNCSFPDCPLDRFVNIMKNLYPDVDRSKCPPTNFKALL